MSYAHRKNHYNKGFRCNKNLNFIFFIHLIFFKKMLATKSDGEVEEKKSIYLDFTQSMFRTANPLANRLRILLLIKTWKKHCRSFPSSDSLKDYFVEGDVEETVLRNSEKLDYSSSLRSKKDFVQREFTPHGKDSFGEAKSKSIKLISKTSNSQKRVTFMPSGKDLDSLDTESFQDSKLITSDRILTQDFLVTKDVEKEE